MHRSGILFCFSWNIHSRIETMQQHCSILQTTSGLSETSLSRMRRSFGGGHRKFFRSISVFIVDLCARYVSQTSKILRWQRPLTTYDPTFSFRDFSTIWMHIKRKRRSIQRRISNPISIQIQFQFPLYISEQMENKKSLLTLFLVGHFVTDFTHYIKGGW